jgi:ribosomal-protein-alanine N-acetyltransferase
MGKRYARNGYMTEAVHGACGFVFDQLSLHRVEAACLPSNEPSKGVLRQSGFRYEGLAKRYLKINGIWQDHMQFALLREEFYPNLGD